MAAFQMCDLEQVTSNLQLLSGILSCTEPHGEDGAGPPSDVTTHQQPDWGGREHPVVPSSLQLFICKTVDLSIKTPSTADMVLFYG